MLSEALVIFACIHSTGCQETSSQYFLEHPEVKQMVKKQENNIKELFGPYIIETLGPALYVATGGTGTIKLHRNWSLQLSSESGILSFRRDF